MNVVAIIQARCGSSRFPDKVFADIEGLPLIWHVVNRLKYSSSISEIVLATTVNPLDNRLYDWAVENKVKVFRGDENDVLSRYVQAALFSNADVVIRITADDPFKEPPLIDKAVNFLLKEKCDLVSNNFPPTYPEGVDVEVFTKIALLSAAEKAKDLFEREHVTQYFYRNPSEYKIRNISNEDNLSHLRWTIDTELDLEMVRRVYSLLPRKEGEIFYMDDILQLLRKYPEIEKINRNVDRSAMYKKF